MKGLLTLLSVATVALIGRAESVANEVVVSAADYGVSKNGRELQTKNLQAALDAAGKLARLRRRRMGQCVHHCQRPSGHAFRVLALLPA